jgi:hypothetical protein
LTGPHNGRSRGRSRAAAIWLLLAAAALAGCSGKRAPSTAPETPADQIGVYKARLTGEEQKSRRFRLLLFAGSPDRLHGEVVSPLGSTLLILDGGDGRLAVTFVRDGVTFAGPAGPEALESVLGLRLGLEELVRGLFEGRIDARGYRVVHEPSEDGALPRRLEIDDGRRRLELVLKRLQPLRAGVEALGTGRPPDGTELRPLDELMLQDFPVDETAGGQGA